ncbi:hypothetical protein [Nonomuraea sp. NPDC052265]|uniref:hypothetical protein n=1 Tax=Nonomuraea sp. NPDC052265 TaxID=3364374 RepID=UPI0037CA37C5
MDRSRGGACGDACGAGRRTVARRDGRGGATSGGCVGTTLGESGDDSSPFTGGTDSLTSGTDGSPFAGVAVAVVGRPGAGTASIQPGDHGPAEGVGGAGDGSATGETAIREGKYDLGISGVS